MCGLTPKGGAAEAWIVTFRVVQGAGGALMFPAALAIVVRTFPLRERGRALAIFFGIAGGLTAIGPILGGYLTQWTWRAIFWVNIPVAVIALVLTYMAKPENEPVPARIDYRGAVLVAVGDRAEHLRSAAVGAVGMGQCRDVGLHHRRALRDRRLRQGRDADGVAAHRRRRSFAYAPSPWRTWCS